VRRDFGLDEQGRERLLGRLTEALRARGRAAHATDIARLLPGRLPAAWPDGFPALGLAQLDARFRIGRGQLIGLAEWPDLGMVTVRGAVREAVRRLHSFPSLDALHQHVQQRVERELPRFVVVNHLAWLGYELDPATGKWITAEPEEDRDDRSA
jgi:hypothetical protein